jgi:hypothetical protein
VPIKFIKCAFYGTNEGRMEGGRKMITNATTPFKDMS